MNAKAEVKPPLVNESTLQAKLPKLPPFNDGKDELDAYLKRFERFATSMKWPKEDWATSLSALLTGRALEVYTRMPSAAARDYDAVKKALLNRYLLSEEGFRIKFRSARPEFAETYTQFVDRISGYLTRWIEIGGVARTYEALFELIVGEQTMKVCSKEMALFLQERKTTSLKELVALADHYAEAHNDRYHFNRKSSSSGRDNRSSRPASVANSGTA